MKKTFVCLLLAVCLLFAQSVFAETAVYESVPEAVTEDGEEAVGMETLRLEVDGDKAVFSDTIAYSPYSSVITRLEGACTGEGNVILLTVPSEEGEDMLVCQFTVEGGTITDYDIFYADAGSEVIEGTYSGTDEELGALMLTVEKGGNAVMTTENAGTFTGFICALEGGWDFMFFDEEETSYFDWMLTLGGGTFTHMNYNEYRYGAYEGVYTIFGDLGELTLNVDPFGGASAYVEIDGEHILMSGDIIVDEETDKLSGVYLSSDIGYTMELDLNLMQDGVWNYYGVFSMLLAAG